MTFVHPKIILNVNAYSLHTHTEKIKYIKYG